MAAIGAKKIPTLEERIEKSFDGYVKTYNFNDNQLKILKRMKDIFAANMVEKREFESSDIFANPVYERIIGGKAEVEKVFEGQFDGVLDNLEKAVKI